MSVVKNLVAEIVDYAGLFPPAKLEFAKVISNYQAYLNGNDRWMLGRLVLPAAKLDELEDDETFTQSSDRWKLSVLIPSASDVEAFAAALKTIKGFNSRHAPAGKAVIDNVELKADCPALASETATKIPGDLQAFLEVPHNSDPIDVISAIANANRKNLFAKIRTGGVSEDLIPTANQVARFIACCAQQGVGFKATAGLHHPLRGQYPLTYAADAPVGSMFGFLNVFIAGAFAFSGQNRIELLERILVESSAEGFNLSEDCLQFGGITVTAEQISDLRQSKLMTFGSCSFTEPTSELAALGWVDEQTSA